MEWKARYAKEDFIRSIDNVSVITISIFIFIALYIMFSSSYQLERLGILFSTIIILEILRRVYNWKKYSINILIISIYLLSVYLEYYKVGHLNLSIEYVKMTRGMLMELIVGICPYLYFAFRTFVVFPIIIIEYQRRMVAKT